MFFQPYYKGYSYKGYPYKGYLYKGYRYKGYRYKRVSITKGVASKGIDYIGYLQQKVLIEYAIRKTGLRSNFAVSVAISTFVMCLFRLEFDTKGGQ